MEEQNLNQNTVPTPNSPEISQKNTEPSGSKNLMYLTTALVLVAVIALSGAGYLYFKHSDKGVLGNSASNMYKAKVSAVPTKAAVASKPKPIAVNNSADLEKLLNELSSSNTASMESDYNQAVSESSNL